MENLLGVRVPFAVLCNTCAAGSFSAHRCVERLSLPNVLGFFAGVNLCDALCSIPARDPARCSVKRNDSATRQGCACSPRGSWCGTHWDARLVGWDAGGTLAGLSHRTGGWKTSNGVITRHCWAREGTSAATKDVVHLAPLARSHVLGIAPHLAAFCSYSTEMHPFEKKDPVSGNSLSSHESV